MWTSSLLLGLLAAAEPVSGHAARAESASFVVVSYSPRYDARQQAEHCQRCRERLEGFWANRQPLGAWSPKCLVVIHARRAEYLQAAGRGAAASSGSSRISFAGGRVATRRIDLCGDSDRGLGALPHELTHVVLADLLGGRQPPRWADEGMALLADSPEKQRLHERDLAAGLADRRAFRLAELMSLDRYPHPARVPAFYGQSASLTKFLSSRDDPARFVEFLRLSLEEGVDRALQQVYAIEHVGELERLWRQQRLAGGGGNRGVQWTFDPSDSDD